MYYTWPGFNSIDFFELKTGATWQDGNWELVVLNYWSPDWSGLGVDSNATEGEVKYTFAGKLFNFFTPAISALIGYQSYEAIVPAGLALAFMERWELSVRYWDTAYSDAECFVYSGGFGNCDARIVGAVSAEF